VHEIVVARGKVLELLRPDDAGKVQAIHSTEVFGIIRSLTPFRCAHRAAPEQGDKAERGWPALSGGARVVLTGVAAAAATYLVMLDLTDG
jgi:hypothetical protein